MFSFLLSKRAQHLKQGRQFVKDARKILDYKRDLWSEGAVAEFDGEIKQLEEACRERDEQKIDDAAKALNTLCGALLPKVEDMAWRDNCEVFLVAIVVALAVRTYFLQPFTIPTGSMQPTLNGILGYPTKTEPPNQLTRLWDAAVHGRTWIDTVAEDDEAITSMEEITRFRFFTYTRIETSKKHIYMVHAPLRTLSETFAVGYRDYQRGETIARGYIDTGDHVFVDKISYQFMRPQRGNVFVFNTEKLPTIDRRHQPNYEPNDPNQFDNPEAARLADKDGWKVDMSAPSQFYIKRLAGCPDDTLRIDVPNLYVNGQLAEGRGFARVMAAQNGYEGYGFGFASFLLPIMRASDDPFTVPPKHYFAMGDNSYHSSDSRDWGAVPEQNIMGRGVFVYWPFGAHWGFIR
jgi:signal peptidase I